MPRARKPWTKTVEVSGVAVRLYERGSAIYREVRLGEGTKDHRFALTGTVATVVVLWVVHRREAY